MNTNTAAACHRNTHYKVEKLVTGAGKAGPFQRSQYVFVYGQRGGPEHQQPVPGRGSKPG